MTHRPQVLFIRTDKIGDLICTLPADQASGLEAFDVTWVVSPGLGEVAKRADPPRSFVEISSRFSWSQFFSLRKFIHANAFSAVVTFQAPGWILFLLWLCRVPRRIGVLSKLSSFLFLNEGIRQKRSQARQHEFQYNLDLVEVLTKSSEEITLSNHPRSEVGRDSELYFKFKKIEKNSQQPGSIKNPIVIHAGMAGSALNWPETFYIELCEKILLDSELNDYSIAWTGTSMDKPYLQKILAYLKDNPNVRVHSLIEKLSFQQLLDFLPTSKAVVAPSTGVLHLAAASDVPTVGIYSPIQVHHPRRWKARGPRAVELLPKVECPGQFACLKEACSHFKNGTDCLQQITVDQVLSTLKHQLLQN